MVKALWLLLGMSPFLVHCGSDGGHSPPPPFVDAGTPTPKAPGWNPLAQLPIAVGEAALAAANGKLFVIGGYDTLPFVQIYDIATDAWVRGPSLPSGTDNAGAVVDRTRLYVFGGEATPLQGALAAGKVLGAFLYGVAPTDPLTLAGTALVLMRVGLLASALPALRAARVEPVVALREE